MNGSSLWWCDGMGNRLQLKHKQSASLMLEQVVLKGCTGGSSTRGDSQFAINGGGMPVDCAHTDHQVLGNMGVGESLREQEKHLDLTRRQPGGSSGWFHRREWEWIGEDTGRVRLLFPGGQSLLRGHAASLGP